MWNNLLDGIKNGDTKSIGRCISLIENEVDGYEDCLQKLVFKNVPIIGVTGPPGAGKSTLTDKLIEAIIADEKKVAVLCIDPSSPFHHGALLGDRIRMSQWYNNENVFIRSIASKATLGGLSPKVIEITDLLKATHFDYIIIETIGVGQNEVEIASLADVTVVVLVPEAGDEIQTMKAGLMEVADIYVVNKCDRVGADTFVKHLKAMLAPSFSKKQNEIEIIKTIASKNIGIPLLFDAIKRVIYSSIKTDKKLNLLVEKAYQLIQNKKMKHISKKEIFQKLNLEKNLNLYNFIKEF